MNDCSLIWWISSAMLPQQLPAGKPLNSPPVSFLHHFISHEGWMQEKAINGGAKTVGDFQPCETPGLTAKENLDIYTAWQVVSLAVTLLFYQVKYVMFISLLSKDSLLLNIIFSIDVKGTCLYPCFTTTTQSLKAQKQCEKRLLPYLALMSHHINISSHGTSIVSLRSLSDLDSLLALGLTCKLLWIKDSAK